MHVLGRLSSDDSITSKVKVMPQTSRSAAATDWTSLSDLFTAVSHLLLICREDKDDDGC